MIDIDITEEDFQLEHEPIPVSTKLPTYCPKEYMQRQRIQAIRLEMIENEAKIKRAKEEYEAMLLSQEILKLDLIRRTPTVKMMAIPVELIEEFKK